MSMHKAVTLTSADADWPVILRERMGKTAPPALQAIGPVSLLRPPKIALFCSASTPGSAILRAHDTARRLRDEGVTVISGFHSPIEKECLRILLRGKQRLSSARPELSQECASLLNVAPPSKQDECCFFPHSSIPRNLWVRAEVISPILKK